MNWTGAKLQRQTKWGKSLQDKQKQHFANVRTNVHKGDHLQDDFVPSFMRSGESQNRPAFPPRAQPSRNHESGPRDHPGAAPGANRMSSVAPRADYRSHRRQPSKQTPRNDPSLHASHATSDSQGRRSRDETSGSKGRRYPSTTGNGGPSCGANSIEHHSTDIEKRHSSSVDTLDLQRRRLLAQSAWLGLHHSKPIETAPASDKGSQRFAKRRRLNQHDRERAEASRQARYRVPSIREDYMMRGALQPESIAEGADSIRIEIGDGALVSQTDAMSRDHAVTASSQCASSEPMLFDEYLDEEPQRRSAADEGFHQDQCQSSTTSRANASQQAIRGTTVDVEEFDPKAPVDTLELSQWPSGVTSERINKDASVKGPAAAAAVNFAARPARSVETCEQMLVTEQPLPVKRSIWDVPSTPAKPWHALEVLAATSLPANQPDSSPLASQAAIVIKPKRNDAQDSDAAWKAFVFGNDRDSTPSSDEGKLPGISHARAGRTTAATACGTSSLLTSSSGMGPPSSVRVARQRIASSDQPTSSFPFDRPSSIANASTTGTILHGKHAT